MTFLRSDFFFEGRDILEKGYRYKKKWKNIKKCHTSISIDNKHNWIDFVLNNKDIKNKDYGDFKIDDSMNDGDSIGVEYKKADKNFDHIEIFEEKPKKYTKEQVYKKKILKEQRKKDKKKPLIGMVGLYPNNNEFNRFREEPKPEDSLELEVAKRQIYLCEAWIKNFCVKTSPNIGIVKDRTSCDFMKIIENYYQKKKELVDNNYVSNGAFIKAAINLGYKFKRYRFNSSEAYFNMVIINKDEEV